MAGVSIPIGLYPYIRAHPQVINGSWSEGLAIMENQKSYLAYTSRIASKTGKHLSIIVLRKHLEACISPQEFKNKQLKSIVGL